jgi:alanine-glyoxylate transaminase/serine-glyoxylate transaminase/serine-pyruvate transaminase
VLRQALASSPADIVAMVQAETSTGVLNPIQQMAAIARERDALTLVDAVTSFGGHPLDIGAWQIDACYSCTQKCLGAPSGLAPVTFGERALAKIKARKSPIPSVYFDALWLEKYWGSEHAYHHTAPIHMVYAFEEALRLVLEEGLEKRWARHVAAHRSLANGLKAMGFELLPPEAARLPMLNAVKLPDGFDEAALRKRLLLEHSIEVGAGLGELKGKVLRVGLMGVNANRSAVVRFLAAFEECLRALGTKVPAGAGVAVALAS